MVSVCLPSDALLQHLPSYLGYLGRGVSLHGCSSKAQPLLLTLDEGYLLTAALPDLQYGIAPLGPPAPAQPRLLDEAIRRGLCRLSDGRYWWWGKLDLCLVVRVMLSKLLIQLSAEGWGCPPSLLVVLPEKSQPWSL